eukprot:1634356-Karenia_brevis.AAC.1
MCLHLVQQHGTPSSEVCAEAFLFAWTQWAGGPKHLVTDKGLHNRGRFSRVLGVHGICIKSGTHESPEQLGRVERHGDIWKSIAKKLISSQKIRGDEDMKSMAYELNNT